MICPTCPFGWPTIIEGTPLAGIFGISDAKPHLDWATDDPSLFSAFFSLSEESHGRGRELDVRAGRAPHESRRNPQAGVLFPGSTNTPVRRPLVNLDLCLCFGATDDHDTRMARGAGPGT